MTSTEEAQGDRLLISGFGVRVPDGAQQKHHLTRVDTRTTLPHSVSAVAEAVAPARISPPTTPDGSVIRITLDFDVPADRLEVFDCELSLTLCALAPALKWLRSHGGTFSLGAQT